MCLIHSDPLWNPTCRSAFHVLKKIVCVAFIICPFEHFASFEGQTADATLLNMMCYFEIISLNMWPSREDFVIIVLRQYNGLMWNFQIYSCIFNWYYHSMGLLKTLLGKYYGLRGHKAFSWIMMTYFQWGSKAFIVWEIAQLIPQKAILNILEKNYTNEFIAMAPSRQGV